ncbi:MAG: hypothetical protein JSS36_07070 [Proteobacteria bacterium]|nr:hypothetical protein [Pseudomonadota bacterium]
MRGREIWRQLGLDGPADTPAIRRAYAERLKAMDLDADPAGYARLREARDTALRLARMAAMPPGASAAPDDPAVAPDAGAAPPPEPWAYAGTRLVAPAPTPGAPPLTARPPDGLAPPPAMPAAGPDLGRGMALPLPRANPLGVVPVIAPDGPVSPVQRADRQLFTLLAGAGEESEIPLDPAELATAQACLRTVLRDAARGDLALHQRIDQWLLHLMRRSWPRCAPLLGEAAAAFGWQAQAGRLGESEDLAWVNARLAGYQFITDVQVPGHVYHKAWSDLTKPGQPRWWQPRRSKLADQKRMLTVIRKGFPEVEQLLSPDRAVQTQPSWALALKQLSKAVFMILLFPAIVLWIGATFEKNLPTAPDADSPQNADYELRSPAARASADPATALIANQAAQEALGVGHDMAWLLGHQPDLADTIGANALNKKGLANGDAQVANLIVELARQRTYAALRPQGGAMFDRVMRQRLAGMRAVLAGPPGMCGEFLRTGTIPGTAVLTTEVRDAERALAASLAEEGRLTAPQHVASTGAMVPGAIIGKVMAETRLSEAQVAKAMQGEGPDHARCAVRAALLKAALGWKGKERAAILRTL